MYLRFVWGRSRLPLTSKDFERKHTIELLRTSNPDGSLPLAHTWYAESAPVLHLLRLRASRCQHTLTHSTPRRTASSPLSCQSTRRWK